MLRPEDRKSKDALADSIGLRVVLLSDWKFEGRIAWESFSGRLIRCYLANHFGLEVATG